MKSLTSSRKTSKASRLLLLDIGNTAVTYGEYQGGRLLTFGTFKNYDIPKLIKKCSKSGLNSTLNVIICSVIPQLTIKFKKSISKSKSCKVWVIDQNLTPSIKHNYNNINKLGSDRKVNIYGALRMYRPPFLLISLGTALTADFVSKKGVFEGGMILPGPETALRALLQRTALLPKHLKFPKSYRSFLGRSTKDCLESGILEGYGSMLDELIRRFKKHTDPKLRVIATGGLASLLKPYTREINILDPRHSVKSLLLLFKNQVVTS